jgi:hypothetical protein
MSVGALGAIVVGLVLFVVGGLQVRRPWGRLVALQTTQDNLRRYSAWRGGRYAEEAAGSSSADLMAAELRRQIRRSGGLAIIGLALIVIGIVVG